ncbi:MAG: hypothetical protein RI885_2750 [Actinomycetota bacterium]
MSTPPSIDIMLGEAATADPLAGRAADDLLRYLEQIVEGSLRIVDGGAASADPDLSVHIALRADVDAAVIERSGGGSDLAADEYVIVSESRDRGEMVWLVGADGAACRTAVFTLLRSFGCDFHLAGDVLPAPSATVPVVGLTQRYTPRFALRGTQLWCYWYSGRDSWDFEHYRAYLDQFAKLGLNLFDFPLYFYEPLYTGYDIDGVRPDGYFLSGRDLETVRVGGSEFDDAPEWFTSAAIPRYGDQRLRSAAAIDLMRRTFEYAASLGIKTCVGIEVANQLDFGRDIAMRRSADDLYEDGRLIQPSSAAAREILTARLSALFDAYPACDFYALWQSEAGVWRTTGGSPHPTDAALRETLIGRYPSLEPSDADYVSWLLLADGIVGDLKPDARLVTSGWGSEAVFACADEVLSDRFVRSSIAPYEPTWALERGGMDFYDLTEGDTWHVTWAETDQHLWVMQPKLRGTAAVIDRLSQSSVSGILALHWNLRFCGINLDFIAAQCWSPTPAVEEFRAAWAARRFGASAAPAAAAALLALEDLNDVMIDHDPTMQSWVGYECFINPLLQAYRFVDADHPLPPSWVTTYVRPHLESGQAIVAAVDVAVGHAEDAAERATSDDAARCARFLHRVRYVRELYLVHIGLAEALAAWNDAVEAVGPAKERQLARALAMVHALDPTHAVEEFIAGFDDEAATRDLGELGLLLSMNEKLLGGVARLRGRMSRAIDEVDAPHRAKVEDAVFTVWPGMGIDTVSPSARDDPHAPASTPSPARPWTPELDERGGREEWGVGVSAGVVCQRFSREIGFWRHTDGVSVTLRAPRERADVTVFVYLVEDVDWDSLFRRQSVVVNGTPIGEYDDFLGRGPDMSEGVWIEAPCRLESGVVTIEIGRRGNSDVVVAGIAVIESAAGR